MIDLPQQQFSRVFVLPLPVFEYLKQYQRALTTRTGQHLNNSQVLAQLLTEHQAHIGTNGNPSHKATTAALLKPLHG